MDFSELASALETTQQTISDMHRFLQIEEKREQITALEKETADPNLWSNQERATSLTKQLSQLQGIVSTWEQLKQQVTDVTEMAQMEEVASDISLQQDLLAQYQTLQKETKKLELFTLFTGKHDQNAAIISIYAGAGGTEAQDWAEMLMRMVLRYAEKKGWKTTLLDESRGTEAGIKSATLRVVGEYAYGHLQGEHGTHRLVRISPFDAEAMRHTSFANIEVIPEIEQDGDVVIDDKDVRIDTFMSSGKGGQSVNTTYSAVRILHIPTGIMVQCQNERSQIQNKETAMRILRSKLQKIKEEEEEKERQALRGEVKTAQWGNQIRSYVLHPYKMVKDVRTKHESQDPESVLNGSLDEFIESYLRWKVTQET